MKKIAILVSPILFLGLVLFWPNLLQVNSESVLDSNGDPVITGQPYSIQLKTASGHIAYFSTERYTDDVWLAPSIDKPSDRFLYMDRGDEESGRPLQTDKNYNLWMDGGSESGFLTKQNTSLFYPHGGAYIQQDREDAMAVSFSKGEDGYYNHTMGLIYRNGMSDIVVSGSDGAPYVIKFFKK